MECNLNQQVKCFVTSSTTALASQYFAFTTLHLEAFSMSHISEVSCTIITMFRMTNFSLTVNSDHFFGKKSQQSGRSFQSFSPKLFPKKELRRDIYCSIAKMSSTTGSCCRIGIKISFTIRYCIHLSQGFTRITCRQQLLYI